MSVELTMIIMKEVISCYLFSFSIITFVALLADTGWTQIPSVKRSKTPRVLEVLGQVENLKVPPGGKVTTKTLIADSLSFSVGTQSIVKVKLDEKRTLIAYGPAEFEIPAITWESREFNQIVLKSGALRFEADENPFPIVLKSPLFEVTPPKGESVFIYDPERALSEAWILEGQMEFGALNAEESAKLTKGQKVVFQGYLEEGEISYDLLLQGRKIPKGKLMPIQLITQQDLKTYSALSDKNKRDQIHRKKTESLRKAKVDFSKALCRNPMGQFNQCVWKKQGESCYRSRCVADGKWKDRQMVDEGACSKGSAIVGACDY